VVGDRQHQSVPGRTCGRARQLDGDGRGLTRGQFLSGAAGARLDGSRSRPAPAKSVQRDEQLSSVLDKPGVTLRFTLSELRSRIGVRRADAYTGDPAGHCSQSGSSRELSAAWLEQPQDRSIGDVGDGGGLPPAAH